MEFQESELVKDFFQSDKLFNLLSLPFKSKKLTAHREFALPSKRRCDILIKNKNLRVFCVIEFKVHAGADALIQALQYRKEVINNLGPNSKHKFGCVIIAAQFFTDDLIDLAALTKTELIHIIPINKKNIRYEYISDVERFELLRTNLALGSRYV